jgi:S1-C subfamily serine protease
LADRAGVQKGDRIIEVNGIKVHSQTDLNVLPKNMKQGDILRGKIDRGGKILELNSTIPKIPFKTEEEKKEKPIKTPL